MLKSLIAYEAEYIRFFNGAIEGGYLNKVPIMSNPSDPEMVIVSACGHAAHSMNRCSHLWERITPLTQLYFGNGGGVVFDPHYARMSSEHDLFHQAAIGQIASFIDLAVEDGTIRLGDALKIYLVYDVPCKVMTKLGWTPQEFVESSIRAKTHFKGFHPKGITLKVGLLYFLGAPIHASGLTWHAPRGKMQEYLQLYRPTNAEPASATMA